MLMHKLTDIYEITTNTPVSPSTLTGKKTYQNAQDYTYRNTHIYIHTTPNALAQTTYTQ